MSCDCILTRKCVRVFLFWKGAACRETKRESALPTLVVYNVLRFLFLYSLKEDRPCRENGNSQNAERESGREKESFYNVL